MPLHVLGAPHGASVALNDNGFLKYTFAFQSLKLCEGSITACQSASLFHFGCLLFF